MASDDSKQSVSTHHIRRNLCMNRPKYRASKRLTAVKVSKALFSEKTKSLYE